MTLAEDLEAYLAEEEWEGPPPAEPELPGDGAEALEQANRWLRAVARLDRDRADLEAVAGAEKARIDGWLRDRTAGMAERRAWLEGQLERLARAWKLRTRRNPPKLANGALRLTPPRPHVEVEDEEAFLAWAREHRPELIRKKEEPDKATMATMLVVGPVVAKSGEEVRSRLVAPGGEVVPGVVTVRAAEDSFKATPA